MGVLVVAICALLALVAAQEEPRIFRRLIPADVIRGYYGDFYSHPKAQLPENHQGIVDHQDFSGRCFASTKCATFAPGTSWDLSPFCGRSTCMESEDQPRRLLELVEDCGPLPLTNPKCSLDKEKTDKTAPFPQCCPVFKCEDGVKLEYPEI